MNRTATLKTSLIALLTIVLLSTASPAAAITDMNGNTAQLQSLVGKGKWTVVKIWASDCHACRKTIQYMTQFKQRFPEAEVAGISVDGQAGRADAQQFIQQYNLTFPNLLSDATEISDYLYANAGDTLVGTPTIVVYNPKGKITAVQPGAVTPYDLIRFIRQQQANTTTSR